MSEVTEKPKKLNSRWRKGAERYSQQRTVEDTRYARDARGHWKRETDSPTEKAFVERRHQSAPWRNGARVRKPVSKGT